MIFHYRQPVRPTEKARSAWAQDAPDFRRKRFGVGYVLGMYNVLDAHYVYPVTPKYLSTVLQQPGRTFLGNITVNYP